LWSNILNHHHIGSTNHSLERFIGSKKARPFGKKFTLSFLLLVLPDKLLQILGNRSEGAKS